ncbi:MAG TPA: hypothetical protein VMU81_13965 [Acetobacteraceae bacterium]|jgi:hypothetical protein|nr:hypothetical protein [Acetobacteraceae bacterium]
MMRTDPGNGIATHMRRQAIAAAAQRLLRNRPRARMRSARSQPTNNMLASFGMVVGLLMVWAMAVSM